jgi:hypothetical protein
VLASESKLERSKPGKVKTRHGRWLRVRGNYGSAIIIAEP